MPLKMIITDPVEVPGPMREFYKKTAEGTYALDLDGSHPDSVKLAEFRANNRALNTSKAELEARLKVFEGIDPAAVRTSTDKHAADIEALRAEKAALTSELATEKAAAQRTAFKEAISIAFLGAGGRVSAVDFMVANAEKVFTMENGAITTERFSTETPGTPLSIKEWMVEQYTVSDFAFMPSIGGGALGNANGGATKRTVGSSPVEFGNNIAEIATGQVTVV